MVIEIGAPRVRVDVFLGAGDTARRLRHDALAGLTASPKHIPSKWFYDDAGSRLFDEITRLPEYYPTAREREILVRRAAAIARATQADTLIELGSGTSEKTRLLLDALAHAGYLTRFVPFDVSESTLREAVAQIAAVHPEIEVHAIVGDFEHHIAALPDGGRRLVAFLGSTLGNLDDSSRAAFFQELSAALVPGDALLLGLDLLKDVSIMEAAYNDSRGITRAFNLNVLRVLNRELRADFQMGSFEHRARWIEPRGWIEMSLESTEDQTVNLAALNLSVSFQRGELLRTEISTKFRRMAIESQLEAARLKPAEWWTDPGKDFALSLSIRT